MKMSFLLARTTLTLACILGSTASHADDMAISTMNTINNVVMMNNTLLLSDSNNQNTNKNTIQSQAGVTANTQSVSANHDMSYRIAMGILLFFGAICLVVTAFFTFA